ncbi:MAG: quinolinate synthase NadA, partial [Propionibacteriaceae bacterium]|nr:quinolinate synthase NadA [Propionibacteriaceae bacterium]
MTTTLITADDLFRRVNHVIPSIEWATMADDVDAILRLKRERGAVILAHNYMRPEVFHGVSDIV